MTEHSPTPWREERGDYPNDTIYIKDADGNEIVHLYYRYFPDPQDENKEVLLPREANARIIEERVNGWHALVAENARLRAALRSIMEWLDTSGDEGFDYGDIGGFYRWYRRNEGEFRATLAAAAGEAVRDD